MFDIGDKKIPIALTLHVETHLFSLVQDVDLEKLQALHIHRVELKLRAAYAYVKIADHPAKLINYSFSPANCQLIAYSEHNALFF